MKTDKKTSNYLLLIIFVVVIFLVFLFTYSKKSTPIPSTAEVGLNVDKESLSTQPQAAVPQPTASPVIAAVDYVNTGAVGNVSDDFVAEIDSASFSEYTDSESADTTGTEYGISTSGDTYRSAVSSDGAVSSGASGGSGGSGISTDSSGTGSTSSGPSASNPDNTDSSSESGPGSDQSDEQTQPSEYKDVYSGSGEEPTDEEPAITNWIYIDKIRAGYSSATEDVSRVTAMRQAGLNTIIASQGSYDPGTGSGTSTFNVAMERYRRWAMAGRESNMHVFLSYSWQLLGDEFKYRRAVLANGTEAVAVCPLDRSFWSNHMNRVGKAIAQLSLDPTVTVDGILLDNEWYGSENYGADIYYRSYGSHTCFCSSCFSGFLRQKGVPLPSSITASARKDWLETEGLLPEYYDYLKAELAGLARAWLTEIRDVNPNMIIGIYPTIINARFTEIRGANWVDETMARVWSTESFPVVLFATDTYYGGGYTKISESPETPYADSGIYIVYCPGYLFQYYSSSAIEENLYRSIQGTNGYWCFRMEQLWGNPASANLCQGTQSQYWQAILNANNRGNLNE